MESKIKKMYLGDSLAIILAMLTLWLFLIYIIPEVLGIAPQHMMKMTIAIVGVALGAFASSSSLAVLVHLKKNQKELYAQELSSYRDER